MESDIFGWKTSHFTRDRDVDLASDGARITAIRALIECRTPGPVVIAHDILLEDAPSRVRRAWLRPHLP
jgi:hypothetical protein